MPNRSRDAQSEPRCPIGAAMSNRSRDREGAVSPGRIKAATPNRSRDREGAFSAGRIEPAVTARLPTGCEKEFLHEHFHFD
jgi:hypothetical protein